MSDDPRPEVELRTAAVSDISFPDRVITVLAVPYEKSTLEHPTLPMVMYRGRLYAESFARGAFKGVESRNGKVMANREHIKGSTVGKVIAFHPDAQEGLIADVKIAKTVAGDETLALADEGMIFPSVGFAVMKGSDQELDHRANPPTRYVRRAFVDHLGFTEDPAYIGADVLAVRSAGDVASSESQSIATPLLDEWVSYLSLRRAGVLA